MSAVLRSQKRPRGLRRLLHACVAPSVFDFWAQRLDRTWTWDRPLARIVERRPESRDAITLVLRPNRHWRGFRAGQHVNVSAEIDGASVTRSYSLSAAPRADGLLAITVMRVAGGKLSAHLFVNACVGDVVHIGPAASESFPLVITRIEMGTGQTSVLRLADAAPIIDQLTDAEVAPAWSSRHGQPPHGSRR